MARVVQEVSRLEEILNLWKSLKKNVPAMSHKWPREASKSIAQNTSLN
jgi:hypothetical protein